MDKHKYIAHRRTSDEKEQSLETHLAEVGELAQLRSRKLGAAQAGKLIGLLHDFGKYSLQFQQYIGSASGKINPDEDEYVEFKVLKGKIDHSSAGAQWVWQACQKWGAREQAVGQILALCIASHHSGLMNCLRPDGTNVFAQRMAKEDQKTHLKECLENAPQGYIEQINALLNAQLVQDVLKQHRKVRSPMHGKSLPRAIQAFNVGFWTRMLFSCLIDADRINSADFEYPTNENHRDNIPDWAIAVQRIEKAIGQFKGEKDIDVLRRDISNTCKQRALEKQGIYKLTVPTGGGKTYASLRYALHHAKHHQLDRIIYVIPFTSIIEQNAEAIRQVVEDKNDPHPWVLEQHSNLEPEHQTWHSKLVSENWDAPIVMTTMVQFLEVLFSGGTRGARKMHQLANSILIFDEIQTLPIKCTHLFCNALNFLTHHCTTTALLCTATQPLLDQLRAPEKGQLHIPPEHELVGDVPALFKNLERVEICNGVRPEGWSAEQIAELARTEFEANGSCLVIVNTKAWAHQLYQALYSDALKDAIFHLSTNLCPAHRKTIFANVRERLTQQLPVLCISTQLIEAGVDVDFACVVRFLAGLDSIAQAAGRCNRHNIRPKGIVHIVNPVEESIDLLTDIKVGRDKAKTVLDEGFDSVLAPEAMDQYFKYYFYDRADQMAYPVASKQIGRDDHLLNLLGHNSINIGRDPKSTLLQQSFMSAGQLFKAIDSPTQAIIVPYGEEASELISALCSVAKPFEAKRYRELLQQAQRFSVNVFSNVFQRLLKEQAIQETQPGEAIYYLQETHHSNEFGLSETPCSPMSVQMC